MNHLNNIATNLHNIIDVLGAEMPRISIEDNTLWVDFSDGRGFAAGLIAGHNGHNLFSIHAYEGSVAQRLPKTYRADEVAAAIVRCIIVP